MFLYKIFVTTFLNWDYNDKLVEQIYNLFIQQFKFNKLILQISTLHYFYFQN